MHSSEFKRCLEYLDIEGVKKLWSEVFPHLPQPSSDQEVLHTLHLARTKARSIPLNLRMYSEQWLKEHEQSKIVSAVGISVNAPAHRADQAKEIHQAMQETVLSSIKSGISLEDDASEIHQRMQQVRNKIKGIN